MHAYASLFITLFITHAYASLPEIALPGASKLASTYFFLFYRNVHVLYTEIYIYSIIGL